MSAALRRFFTFRPQFIYAALRLGGIAELPLLYSRPGCSAGRILVSVKTFSPFS